MKRKQPTEAGRFVTRFRCVVCGKLTAGRISRDGRFTGDTTHRYPRQHYVAGKLCPGVLREAELVDVEVK